MMSRISNAVHGVVIFSVPWICERINRYGRLQALAGTQTERRAVRERGHSEHRLLFSLFSRNPESFYEIGGFQTTLARNMVNYAVGLYQLVEHQYQIVPGWGWSYPNEDAPFSEPGMRPHW